MTGGMVAFAEGPIDFYKSQMQVQALRNDGMKGKWNFKPLGAFSNFHLSSTFYGRHSETLYQGERV